MSQWPDKSRLDFVDREAISAYLDTLFGAVEWDDGMHVVCLGTFENGGKGRAREPLALHPATTPDWKQKIEAFVRDNSLTGYSSFISPAIYKEPPNGDKLTAKREYITHSLAIICDFDTGNPDAQLKKIEEAAGAATMVVASGGTTDEGHTKIHAYWLLDEPTTDHDAIEAARAAYAKHAGSDASLARAAQNIRIPGSCHCKGGSPSACAIVECDPFVTYDSDAVMATAKRIEPQQGMHPEPGQIGFTLQSSKGKPDADTVLTTPVRKGAKDEWTRWDGIKTVIGKAIQRVNEGTLSDDEGKAMVHGYMVKCVEDHEDFDLDYQWGLAAKKWLDPDRKERPLTGSAPAPEPEAEEKGKTWRDFLIDPFDDEPPPPPIYSLAGQPICTAGNISVMSAHVKTGKSSAIAAMLASSFGMKDRDTFTFESDNPEGKGVIYVDTEQSRWQARALMNSAMRRVGVTRNSIPRWFYPIGVRGQSHKNMQKFIGEACKEVYEMHGIHSIFIDGSADLVRDVNDAEECDDLISAMEEVATEFNTSIMTAIHKNPNSDKERGHLGSELQRKAETILMLKKEQGVTAMHTPIARGAEISLSKGPRFRWNEESQMHRSCTKSGEFSEHFREMSWREQLCWIEFSIGHAAAAGFPFSKAKRDGVRGLFQRRQDLHPWFTKSGTSHTQIEALRDKLIEEGRVVIPPNYKPIKAAMDVADGAIALGDEQSPGAGAYSPPTFHYYEYCNGNIIDLRHRQDSKDNKQITIAGFTPGL